MISPLFVINEVRLFTPSVGTSHFYLGVYYRINVIPLLTVVVVSVRRAGFELYSFFVCASNCVFFPFVNISHMS